MMAAKVTLPLRAVLGELMRSAISSALPRLFEKLMARFLGRSPVELQCQIADTLTAITQGGF